MSDDYAFSPTSRKKFTRHASDEERQAAIKASKLAWKQRDKEASAKIRQSRDTPVKEFRADPKIEINALVDKHQLGTINSDETTRLKSLLQDRYK